MGGIAKKNYNPIKKKLWKKKTKKTVKHVFNTDVISFDIAQKDKYELDLQGKFEVVLREGKYYVERIKPQYPKSYEECCKVLCYEPDEDEISCYQGHLIESFVKLLICRNSYWKIVGKQIGLGNPWSPNWKDNSDKYFICYLKDELWMSNVRDCNRFLVFSTEETRDTFFENFKDLIEQCKELL